MTAEEGESRDRMGQELADRMRAQVTALGDQQSADRLTRQIASLEKVAAHSATSRRPTTRWTEDEVPDGPVAMVPVVQLLRSEAGDLLFPEGADLLQILWCPNTHRGWRGPRPLAVWRDSGTVGDLLEAPPPCALANEKYVPRPCVAHPEQLMEFPPICTISDLTGGELVGQLPAELEQRLRRWNAAQPESEDYPHLSHAPGWKIGGWDASWPDAAHQETCACGAPMRPLLEVDSGESLESVWSPHEEPHFRWGEPRHWQDEEPTGVHIGRNGMYWVHVCSLEVAHPLGHGLE